MVEEGEIEDGEVPEEEGELRDSESDEDKTEKRKAGSPVLDPTQQKRQKIEDDEAEEGELSSEDGEINSPEPMDYSTQDISDADLAALGGEMLTDKTTKKIDWTSILPKEKLNTDVNMEKINQINPENILRNANLGYYKDFLIRNQNLKAQLETILSKSPESSVEESSLVTKSSLGNVLKANRIRFGMDEKIPIRPFMPPNVINGELSHKITQFILKKT